MAPKAPPAHSDQLTADERAVIVAVVDKFPPLTQSTRATLSALLRGTVRGGAR